MQLTVDIRDSKGGALLPVRAQPGARRNAIVGLHDGRLKVAVSAPPDKGKANDALIRVLAEALNISRSDIELASGAGSREKVFAIAKLPIDELRKRLEVELARASGTDRS